MATPRRKRAVPIRRYQRHLNIGVFIFSVIFLYTAIYVGIYLSRERISIYEITVKGSITKDRTFTGIALREEEVITATTAGYVNYYAREGERVKVGDTIFTLDESGKLSEMLFSKSDVSLKEADLTSLKNQLNKFSMNFNPMKFSDIYDIRMDTDYTLLELANSNNMTSLEQLLNEQGNNGLFHREITPKTGTVAYYTDGYEEYTPQMLSASDFANATYKKNVISTSVPLEAGNPVYKLITSEDWTITFPIKEEEAFVDKTSLTILIQKDNFKVTAPFQILTGSDGSYGMLSFDRYMIRYLEDRFLTFEVIEQEETGFKIPKTAMTEKTFYTIPIEFLVTNEENDKGFQLEEYDAETQETTMRFISANLYLTTDTVYYVDTALFEPGSYLVNQDHTERYQVGATQPLKGVYTVNQGYTVFRVIDIISENSEYYIVRTDTPYGLSMYDHIILNSKTVAENDIIFQ